MAMPTLPVIVGSGSYVCRPLVPNEQLFEWLRPRKPDGELVRADWVERNLGIRTRSFDLDLSTATKRSREEGGLYDGDLAVRAARAALEDAQIDGGSVDVLVHVSCTPDTLYFNDHLRFMTRELGMRRDAHLLHLDLGCAGLAPAFRAARSELSAEGSGATVLVVASHCSSSHLTRDTISMYLDHPHPWAWLSTALFGDGAGALVLQPAGEPGRGGLVRLWYETQPELTLVSYAAGGGAAPTSSLNASEHVFVMEAQTVGRSFTPMIRCTFERMVRDWPGHVEPVVGHAFDVDRIKRWYFHQANPLAVRRTAEEMGLPLERVPTNAQCYGNTCAASTLLLFDADRRSGALEAGDLVAFLWVGAGNGAQYGYAVVVV
jgi:3-oxoacyl-[acyl-carrier-protein] synthase-3